MTGISQGGVSLLQDLAVVAVLILLNGLFSMAELAMVSARRGALQQMAQAGNRGARAALKIAERPGRFLSTVQVGITLVGILAGAYSSARFAGSLAALLEGVPHAPEIAFGLVVTVITFLSIVVGELVPKQLALNHAAAIAAWTARPLNLLSRLALPVVALLDLSAGLGLRLLRQRRTSDAVASEEEVRRLIAESTRAGVFTPGERDMMDRVMGLADRPVRTLMTPRTDVEWLDAAGPPGEALAALRQSLHSRLPLCRGRIDDIVGIVRAKDVADRQIDGGPLDLAALATPPAIVPESASALRALELLKACPAGMAVVIDEHGGVEGVVTGADVLESIVGRMQDAGDPPGPHELLERPDGTLLVDAAMELDEAHLRFRFPQVAEGGYHTLAGFVMARAGRVPTTGERVHWEGWVLEVVDLDGRRIDKLLVTPPAPATPDPGA